MFRSSKKEDPSYSSSSHRITHGTFSWQVFFSRLFFKAKSGDDFYDTIKQLQSSSKKMTLDEKNIFMNLLKFGHKTVADIMIPRSDIVAVKLTISLEALNQMMLLQVPHTRTLVYEGTLDNIVGFIHIKDLFKVLVTKQNFQLKKIIHQPIISASSMKLVDLLATMRRDRIHISVVVDEYGGTDGIVTIEDIMEALVGRIDDEHDKKSDNNSFRVLNNNTILSNARVKVENLEAILGVKLKETDDEFDTIGGLVLAKVGTVPLIGTKIDILEHVELEVIDANSRVLKQVKLRLKDDVLQKQGQENS